MSEPVQTSDGLNVAATSSTRERTTGVLSLFRTRWLIVSMVLAVALVGGLGYWDETRQSEDELEDLGSAQAELAEIAARTLRLSLERSGGALDRAAFDELDRYRRAGASAVFLLSPGASVLRTPDGREVAAPALLTPLKQGATSARVSRAEAQDLGLSRRTAMAGLARIHSGTTGEWGVVVVRSAERQRDRDRHGQMRLVLSVLLATGLVVVFGGMALSKQRSELQLAHELEVARVAREKDVQLEKANRAATMVALASGVAHELSTPLAVIIGRAEQLLSRAGSDERTVRSATTIIEQANDIHRIIRGLLGLASGASLNLETAEPEHVVREAVRLVEHRYDAAGVTLEPRVTSRLPVIRCEPLLLRHALVNLLLNACDASTAGRAVHLDVDIDGSAVSFAVVDEGEGITPANAARATEPFFTTKPAGKGTGLGLAIASEIAKTHRGSLSIAPHAPRGTRAVIMIPVEGGAHGIG